jgi:hypothetical protein
MSETLEAQNRIMISLLARTAIGIENIEKIVRSNKKKGDPDKFVSAYNALDGSKSGTDLAKIVGITKQGMNQVLQTWEEEGIIYKAGNPSRYFKLLKIPSKTRNAESNHAKKKIAKRTERATISLKVK